MASVVASFAVLPYLFIALKLHRKPSITVKPIPPIPDEIILKILHHLVQADTTGYKISSIQILLRCSQVNKSMRKVALDPSLWRAIIVSNWNCGTLGLNESDRCIGHDLCKYRYFLDMYTLHLLATPSSDTVLLSRFRRPDLEFNSRDRLHNMIYVQTKPQRWKDLSESHDFSRLTVRRRAIKVAVHIARREGMRVLGKYIKGQANYEEFMLGVASFLGIDALWLLGLVNHQATLLRKQLLESRTQIYEEAETFFNRLCYSIFDVFVACGYYNDLQHPSAAEFLAASFCQRIFVDNHTGPCCTPLTLLWYFIALASKLGVIVEPSIYADSSYAIVTGIKMAGISNDISAQLVTFEPPIFVDVIGQRVMLFDELCDEYEAQYPRRSRLSMEQCQAATPISMLGKYADVLQSLLDSPVRASEDRIAYYNYALGAILAHLPPSPANPSPTERLILVATQSFPSDIDALDEEIRAICDLSGEALHAHERNIIAIKGSVEDGMKHAIAPKYKQSWFMHSIGDIVYVKSHPQLVPAVIIDCDHVCGESQQWKTQNQDQFARSGPQQPFYRVLAIDGNELYIAQENVSYVWSWLLEERLVEWLLEAHIDRLGELFQNFDSGLGRFIMNPETRARFCSDLDTEWSG